MKSQSLLQTIQSSIFAANRSSQSRSPRRRLRAESLETRQLLAADILHNDLMPTDVNHDGSVTPLDALVIINQLNRESVTGPDQPADQPTSGNNPSRPGSVAMVDVNDDGDCTALDALMVINRINHNQALSQQDTDPVLFWNDVFGDVLVDSLENQNPGYASRSNAMLNLAIFDSVTLASSTTDATFYQYETKSSEVAASGAAYTILSELYPDQQKQLDAALQDALTMFPADGDPATSFAIGEDVANQIFELRLTDGFDVVKDYTYTDEIGYFQADPLDPDVPTWGVAWGDLDTFSISSTDDFLPGTTPPLTSEEYAASYDEVLALGSLDSTERTAEETEIGLFWAYDVEGTGTPIALYNNVLESVAKSQGNTFEENVALFAQASVAMADAAIVAWDTKFTEEFWRPVTAIHSGDIDGNDLTDGDVDWVALGAPDGDDDVVGFTPPFPTYISGHATFGGALFGTLQEFYGTDDVSFELSSTELELLLNNPDLQDAYGLDLDDAIRSFDSFSEAMAENGRSRVYLGIHFDFDDTVGQEVGQAIAASVASQFAAVSNDGNGDTDVVKNSGDGGKFAGQSEDRFDAIDLAFADEQMLF